ncbi:MAG: galactose-1-phosphate uridylyltransferase [Acidobacteria bacterium]|nr:MAG: galactose-1-phosphate uridylyltransferase [Acidobacteriota bacterium]
MPLRKDPVTQSWVILEDSDFGWPDLGACPLCPGQEHLCLPNLYQHPQANPNWQVRVVPHPCPVYQVDGDVQRRGEGLYDKMRALGAHEVVIEHPDHNLPLSQQSDESVAQVLRAFASRVGDLKKDRRFRYVTVFRNQGAMAGQDLEHPHSQITATPFIPRRVGYELRSAQRYFQLKERCLFCDILRQEMTQKTRTVEWDDLFLTFCPFASRVPYETWVMPLHHHASFEEHLTSWDQQLCLGRCLKSILRRLESVASSYHLVLHTSPNLGAKFERAGNWQTVREDYHWHCEILPVIPSKSKSYSLKEVYYNSLTPEAAAEALRELGKPTGTSA